MTLLESVSVAVFILNTLNFPVLIVMAKRSIKTTDLLLRNSPIIDRLDHFAGRTHLNSQLGRIVLLSMAFACEPMLRKQALFDDAELRAFPRKVRYSIQIPSFIATGSFITMLVWWLATLLSLLPDC